MMILSSLIVVLCLVAPSLSKPATIVSGFGVDEILKEAQVQQEKMEMKSVDSSPEVGRSPVVDGSTEDEKSSSHEKSNSHELPKTHESHHVETVHLEPNGDDGIVMGREHIHDPEHGNDDVVIDDHHKMHKVTTQMFGSGDDVEIGGNSESPKPIHHHHTEHHHNRFYNPVEITQDQQEFKKGLAPTEIVWSPSIMSNGYNGGVRRPEYRRAVYFVQRH
ncbi:unnamed protein product [Caenorhabditis brenneri]